ncbi:SDR family NAD(P)-dependent oxidoreductase [Nocardia sp. R16R-3T]
MGTRDLEGKVAVVTGGTSGIGLRSVELFVERGAQVVVGDIAADAGKLLEERFDGKVGFQMTDVTDPEAIESLVALATTRYGKLDVMFNNAGAVGDPSTIADLTADGFDGVVALLARSVFLGHKFAIRTFLAQGTPGTIVSTASVAGLEGGWLPVGYAASKAAVMSIVRQTVAEYGAQGIRSNAIAPGVILTPFVSAALGVPGDYADDFTRYVEEEKVFATLGRPGLPEDVAEVAAFLASDASRFVNGVSLPVDGGATAITHNQFGPALYAAAQRFVESKSGATETTTA